MLVLTRKSDQKVVIGSKKKVVITVLKVQGGMVSLGFEADRDTPIYREELLVEIEQENTGGAVDQENPVQLKVIAEDLAKKLKIKPRRNHNRPTASASKSEPVESAKDSSS